MAFRYGGLVKRVMKRTTIWLTPEQVTRLDLEARRRRMVVAELIRLGVDTVTGATGDQTPYAVADPTLQAMADGLRREAASRGLPVETIIQTWFQMMRPALPTGGTKS